MPHEEDPVPTHTVPMSQVIEDRLDIAAPIEDRLAVLLDAEI
ncbi:MAG: hypothetical protein OEZ08_03190 [Betaproteobacteria bacterium]|nr:hypothetical protein [Betaproteobacteria bacterium]